MEVQKYISHKSVIALNNPAKALVCSNVAKLKAFTITERTATVPNPRYAVFFKFFRIYFVFYPACVWVLMTSQG